MSPIATSVKRAVLNALTSSALSPVWRPLVSDTVAIMMLHRFSDPERGIIGVSPAALRENLAYLRRRRFQVASFQDLLAASAAGRRPTKPSVVFTIDDGYADFVRVAAPVFAEFDCPVTVFLTTGPIDRPAWLWWDRVEFVFGATRRSEITLDVGGSTKCWRWHSPAERATTVEQVTECLKLVPNEEKEAIVAALAERLDVAIPATPTPQYAAMTWNDVRRCGARGVTFAPHTVNHPILSQLSDAEAEWEMLESWRRLRIECDSTVPVFCYPNGSFTEREVGVLARSELAAAVTTNARYASTRLLDTGLGNARFRIPRFAYHENHAQFRSVVTGFERVNLAMRFGRDGWHAVGEGGPADGRSSAS